MTPTAGGKGAGGRGGGAGGARGGDPLPPRGGVCGYIMGRDSREVSGWRVSTGVPRAAAVEVGEGQEWLPQALSTWTMLLFHTRRWGASVPLLWKRSSRTRTRTSVHAHSPHHHDLNLLLVTTRCASTAGSDYRPEPTMRTKKTHQKHRCKTWAETTSTPWEGHPSFQATRHHAKAFELDHGCVQYFPEGGGAPSPDGAPPISGGRGTTAPRRRRRPHRRKSQAAAHAESLVRGGPRAPAASRRATEAGAAAPRRPPPPTQPCIRDCPPPPLPAAICHPPPPPAGVARLPSPGTRGRGPPGVRRHLHGRGMAPPPPPFPPPTRHCVFLSFFDAYVATARASRCAHRATA